MVDLEEPHSGSRETGGAGVEARAEEHDLRAAFRSGEAADLRVEERCPDARPELGVRGCRVVASRQGEPFLAGERGCPRVVAQPVGASAVGRDEDGGLARSLEHGRSAIAWPRVAGKIRANGRGPPTPWTALLASSGLGDGRPSRGRLVFVRTARARCDRSALSPPCCPDPRTRSRSPVSSRVNFS